MKTILTGLAISLCAWGAIGDNAPSIPAGYVSAHPRLGGPTNTYLQSVWDNRAGGAKYIFDNATAWNPSNPYGGGATLATSNCRYLLIAYLASRAGGSPDSTYLTKIKSLANLQTDWDISAGNSYWQPGICTALAYDWIYSDLDSTARAGMLANMNTMMSGFEANYVSAGSSPIND